MPILEIAPRFLSELNSEPDSNPLGVSEGENEVLAKRSVLDLVWALFRGSIRWFSIWLAKLTQKSEKNRLKTIYG